MSRTSNQSSKVLSVKAPDQVKKRIVYLIDKPAAPQTVISIGRVGVQRLTEDYFPISVMNTILGGSFSSRLNQNLREEHGYTYGAFSSFQFRPLPGPFVTQASVQTEITDSALIQFFKELNGIREEIPDAELSRAKNYLALGYPANFQTVGDIANQISEIIQYSLPESYFNEYIPSVKAVTLAQTQEAADEYIIPDQMIVVIVGDKAKIEEGIRKLNLGEIKNFTIKDVLGEMPKIDETM
jgi:zinc protease